MNFKYLIPAILCSCLVLLMILLFKAIGQRGERVSSPKWFADWTVCERLIHESDQGYFNHIIKDLGYQKIYWEAEPVHFASDTIWTAFTLRSGGQMNVSPDVFIKVSAEGISYKEAAETLIQSLATLDIPGQPNTEIK